MPNSRAERSEQQTHLENPDLKEIRRLAIYSELAQVQPRAEFQSAYQSIEAVLKQIIDSMRTSHQESMRDGELPTVVFTIQAAPGSGKSYSMGLVLELLELESIEYTHIHWDTVEEVLRTESKITTPQDQPFTDTELKLVYDRILQMMHAAAQPGRLLILDLPSETSLRIPIEELELSDAPTANNQRAPFINARRYATQLLQDFVAQLTHTQPEQESRDTIEETPKKNNHPKVEIYINHLLAGPCLDLLRELRFTLQLLKDLNKPNQIRALFGLRPLTASELEKVAQQLGGSIGQVDAADAAVVHIWNTFIKPMRGMTYDMLEQLAGLKIPCQEQIALQFITEFPSLPRIDDLRKQIALVAEIRNMDTAARKEYEALVQLRLAMHWVIQHNSKRLPQTPECIRQHLSIFFSNPDELFHELFTNPNEEMIERLKTVLTLVRSYYTNLHHNKPTENILQRLDSILDSVAVDTE